MLTTIVLVLVLLAIAVVAAWWFLDFDMPEVVIPVAAPGIGAGLIYWYGTALAWAIGLLLLLIGGYGLYRLVGGRRRDDQKPPKLKTGQDAACAPPASIGFAYFRLSDAPVRISSAGAATARVDASAPHSRLIDWRCPPSSWNI